jgi:hypothetical protein
MARWIVYAQYGGETFEAEVADPDLETEEQVIADGLEFIQVWVEKVGDE